ncbi:MAG: ABC transporter ATP-binding protein [Pirellulales bacterium]
MKNFFRALRLTFAYPGTMAAALFSALLVAVLWGGNIGTIYPIVEVVFKGQSLGQWADTQLDASQQRIADFEREIDRLDREIDRADGDVRNSLIQQRTAKEQRLAAEHDALARTRWIAPWLHQYMPDGPFATLLLVIGVLLTGTLIKDVFLVIEALLTERLAQQATLDLRNAFYRRTLRMDLASFGEQTTSDLLSRFTNDMSSVTIGIHVFFGRAVREPLKLIACLAGAAWVCWPLLLLSLAVVPPAMLLVRQLARSMKRASRKAMEEMSLLYNVLVETFNGIKVVKAFTMERYERLRFHRGAREFYRRAMKMARYDALVRPTTELAGMVMIALAILAGAYLVLNQETHLLGIQMSQRPLSLAELLLFYAMLAGTSDPVRKMADVWGQLQKSYAAADRVYEMYDREPKIAEPVQSKPLPRHRRDIVFDNVSFGYQTNQQVLDQINLRIAFGETLAIVGPNGCGKSTLANLIPRFFDPIEGAVRLDGVDLRETSRRGLRRQVGLVTQETLLFNDTVLNNIRYGRPNASRDDVIAAAKKGHAHRFITEKLAEGYDTPVGASGGRLSGGERQRIALARAILRDPAILILDEATSQIDLESEQLIGQTLAEFARGRTTVLITHRLSLLDLADRILVMDRGRIVDLGTHAELMARCDLYARVYRLDLRASA